MKPPTSEDITRQLQQAHLPQNPGREVSPVPIADTPMVVSLEQLRPYELNPRVVRNPLYDDIKASIRERGLDQPPSITRRPNEPHFIIRNGGNTRLSILSALWQETREERFFRIHCLFRPWQSEAHALSAIKAATNCRVHGPHNEPIPLRDHALAHGDQFQVLDRWINVLGVPGHTAGHLAYELPQERKIFCGDTLFSAGCGKVFEGSPTQMLASLDAHAALPESTKVYCAHEYTVSNLRFVLAVKPENLRIAERLAEASEARMQGLCTLPSTIAIEFEINPFLRIRQRDQGSSTTIRGPSHNGS
ncbi:Hydroxyacylglutathione hydrolase [compost metagenome]